MNNKKIFQKAVYVLFGLALFTSCSHSDTNISISDSTDEFNFHAEYDAGKTAEVYQYLNKALAPQRLFDKPRGHVEARVKLNDETEIELEAERGELFIRMKKDENSPASYRHMKVIYDDLANLIK